MRKTTLALLGLGLLATALPAEALDASKWYDEEGGVISHGGPTRSNDCDGDVTWDGGMTDDFTPPEGCSSAISVGCFINAINDAPFPMDGRRLADDFVSDGRVITGIKIWARYNASGYDYHLANPGSLHGFCVKFYDPIADPPWCPNGTVDGEGAIGVSACDVYVTTFVEHEITGYLPRNFNYCLSLPAPFFPQVNHPYFVSVSADFDFTTWNDGVTQYFQRVYTGNYEPFCEGEWWDTWNTTTVPWIRMSVAVNMPCWAGWDGGFVLYSNITPPPIGVCCDPVTGICLLVEQTACQAPAVWHPEWTSCDPNPCPLPPVPVERSSWGRLKSLYH